MKVKYFFPEAIRLIRETNLPDGAKVSQMVSHSGGVKAIPFKGIAWGGAVGYNAATFAGTSTISSQSRVGQLKDWQMSATSVVSGVICSVARMRAE